jgi:transcriptional regulator with XRE-family HTH domain
MKYDIALIQRERMLKGWSQSDLAERIGMSPSWVSRLEAGLISGTPRSIKAAADALGIAMSKLIIVRRSA